MQPQKPRIHLSSLSYSASQVLADISSVWKHLTEEMNVAPTSVSVFLSLNADPASTGQCASCRSLLKRSYGCLVIVPNASFCLVAWLRAWQIMHQLPRPAELSMPHGSWTHHPRVVAPWPCCALHSPRLDCGCRLYYMARVWAAAPQRGLGPNLNASLWQASVFTPQSCQVSRLQFSVHFQH